MQPIECHMCLEKRALNGQKNNRTDRAGAVLHTLLYTINQLTCSYYFTKIIEMVLYLNSYSLEVKTIKKNGTGSEGPVTMRLTCLVY